MNIGTVSTPVFLFWQQNRYGGLSEDEFFRMVFWAVVFSFLIGIGFVLQYRRKRRRVRSLRKFAGRNGWTLDPKPKKQILQNFRGFPMFGQTGEKIRNLLQKDFGPGKALIFDYSYPVRNIHDDISYRHLTVLAFYAPHLNLPHFALYPRPKSLGIVNFIKNRFQDGLALKDIDQTDPKLARKFREGIERIENMDITFDSHLSFSALYLLTGGDKPRIREYFRPEVLEYFESLSKINVAAGGPYLFVHRGEEILNVMQLEAEFKTAVQIYGLFQSRV